jgi:hypothetical protein
MIKGQTVDLIKDWSILLIRNTKGTFLQRAFYWALRTATRADYNHCQLVREFGGRLFICESDVSGFRISKTLDKWIEEQKTKQRGFLVINRDGYIAERFDEILGNQYDAKYWTYVTGRYSPMGSSNCFQSVAYIFNFEKYWLATANSFI